MPNQKRCVIASFLIVSLVATTSPSFCQSPPDSVAAPCMHAAQWIREGSTIRAGSGELGDVRGRLLRTTTDTLFVGSAGAERAIPIPGISELWIERHSSKTGAKVGALVGGIGLGVLAAYGCSADGGSPTGDVAGDCFGPVVLVALGGAAVGALIGALIGSSIPKWEKRCP